MWRDPEGVYGFSGALDCRKMVMEALYDEIFPQETHTEKDENSLSSSLLEPLLLVRRAVSAPPEDRGKPLMIEFSVDPRLSPFLVSAAKRTVLWKEEANDGKILAALRPADDYGGFFQTVVEEVYQYGRKYRKGNAHPMTRLGLRRMVEHVQGYGLSDLVLLLSDRNPLKGFSVDGAVVKTASWLDPAYAVVVPEDRSFLGVLLTMGSKFVSVIHNPTRGMAVGYDERLVKR